jgi:hypothetical protein
VWDPSLVQATAQTVLLRVAEPAQCLACAAVLAVGDTVLVKDVCIERGLVLGDIELSVDRCSQICVCVDASDNEEGGQHRACTGSYGFCLPCVAVQDLDTFGESGGGVKDGWRDRLVSWPDRAPALREAASAGVLDALLSFRGAVMGISTDPLPLAACPECGCPELRRMGLSGPEPMIEAMLEDESGEAATNPPMFVCSACEGICHRPLRASAAVRVSLNSGVEVLLAGTLLERAAAAAAASSRSGGIGRRAGEGSRAFVGRELSGIAVRRRKRPRSGCDSGDKACQWELRVIEVNVVS